MVYWLLSCLFASLFPPSDEFSPPLAQLIMAIVGRCCSFPLCMCLYNCCYSGGSSEGVSDWVWWCTCTSAEFFCNISIHTPHTFTSPISYHHHFISHPLTTTISSLLFKWFNPSVPSHLPPPLALLITCCLVPLPPRLPLLYCLLLCILSNTSLSGT